jgi:hypothetical protein
METESMKRKDLSIIEWKELQENTVSKFIEFYRTHDNLTIVIYEDWTAKDVLGHVTSWHMSFARNLLDAVNGNKPNPFRGSLTSVNELEVKKMSVFSVIELINKIEEAQNIIANNILSQNIIDIAYKKGSRNYPPIEHLEIVARHINGHLDDINKKYS